MFQMMQAIAFMHKHGFFHRDIKPENTLIKVRGNTLLHVLCVTRGKAVLRVTTGQALSALAFLLQHAAMLARDTGYMHIV